MSGIQNKVWVLGGTLLLDNILEGPTDVNFPRCREQFFSWVSWGPCQVGTPCCHLPRSSYCH